MFGEQTFAHLRTGLRLTVRLYNLSVGKFTTDCVHLSHHRTRYVA